MFDPNEYSLKRWNQSCCLEQNDFPSFSNTNETSFDQLDQACAPCLNLLKTDKFKKTVNINIDDHQYLQSK